MSTITDNPQFEVAAATAHANDGAADELLQRMAMRCGITINQAAEAWEFCDEHQSSNVQMTRGNLAEALRQRDKYWLEFIEKIFDNMLYRISKQVSDSRLIHMTVRVTAYALGLKLTATGNENGAAADIARICNLKNVFGASGKFTVCKALEQTIERLNLDKLPGQRGEAACREMELARQAQLEEMKK